MATFAFKNWNLDEFVRIRNAVEEPEQIAIETVARCNTTLHAAQRARNQPVEDGYTHSVRHGDRVFATIYPYTARAIAHEAVNHTILKSLPSGRLPDLPPDRSVPRELAERSNQARKGGGDLT